MSARAIRTGPRAEIHVGQCRTVQPRAFGGAREQPKAGSTCLEAVREAVTESNPSLRARANSRFCAAAGLGAGQDAGLPDPAVLRCEGQQQDWRECRSSAMRAAAQGAGLSLCRGHWPGLGREMADEPVPGQRGDRVEGARLLEQMAGAGHHR
jgi:hypothetical protein